MNQVGMTAGADAWVNGPYVTDAHRLWEAMQSAPPPPKPRGTTARRKKGEETERVPPRRRQTPGEKAFGLAPGPVKSSRPVSSPAKRPPASLAPAASEPVADDLSSEKAGDAGADEKRSEKPAKQSASGSGSDRAKQAASGSGSDRTKQQRAKSAGDGSDRSKAKKAKAKTQRSRSPAATLVQPEWDSRGPPRRAPGEVVNKYNHRGTLGIRGALTTRPTGGFDSSVSVAESDVTTATGRPDRVTNSPSGKFHPNPDRRFELRQSDMFSNINYFATSRVTNATSKTGDAVYGAPDNDRKMKEASWISSQAWFESLRYYPQGEEAAKNDDCPVTFSGNTHGASYPDEHLETDVRNRVGIAPADPGWMPHQLPEPWAPEMEVRMKQLHLHQSVASHK